MRKLFETDGSRLALLQRLALALVVAPHGAQKLLGWFGGYGFSGTMGFLVDTVGLPAPLAFLVIAIESFGMLALALGLFTRIVALGLAAVMVGAVATVHGKVGFFMNWFGQQSGEGYEFHLLALALAIPLVVRGAGALSVDRVLADRRSARAEVTSPVPRFVRAGG